MPPTRDISPSALAAERAHHDALYSGVDVAGALPDHIIAPVDQPLWSRHVGDLAGKRVLECGSGDGLWAVWLAKQGATVTAVELSPIGVEKTRARARVHGLHDRVTAVCGDCCRLETFVDPGSIDLVFGSNVLHHLPPVDFGRSVRAVLRDGGRALFLENSAANPVYRLGRRLCNRESAMGSPLTRRDVELFVEQVGRGTSLHPHFGLFGFMKAHVFRGSSLFATIVDAVDRAIDAVPGARRWSAHMWVFAEKPARMHDASGR